VQKTRASYRVIIAPYAPRQYTLPQGKGWVPPYYRAFGYRKGKSGIAAQPYLSGGHVLRQFFTADGGTENAITLAADLSGVIGAAHDDGEFDNPAVGKS
jgi:hypothetical protein